MKKLILLSIVTVFVVGVFIPAAFAEGNGDNDDFQGALKIFKDGRGAFQKVKGESNMTNFSDYQSKLFDKSKDLLSKSLDVLKKRSEQLRKKVESGENIYGDLLDDLLGDVDGDLSALTAFKARIQAATSTEQLRQLALELQARRQDDKSYQRKLIILSHIGNFEKSIIKAAENRSERLKEKIEAIKAQGKNVSELETLLTQANQKISQAKEAINNLRKDIDLEKNDVLNIADVQKKLNDIRDILKEVYQIFRQIAIKGNELFGNPILPVATTTTSTATTTN